MDIKKTPPYGGGSFFYSGNIIEKKTESVLRNHNMKNRLLTWGVTFTSFGIGMATASFIGDNDFRMLMWGGTLGSIGLVLSSVYVWIK